MSAPRTFELCTPGVEPAPDAHGPFVDPRYVAPTWFDELDEIISGQMARVVTATAEREQCAARHRELTSQIEAGRNSVANLLRQREEYANAMGRITAPGASENA